MLLYTVRLGAQLAIAQCLAAPALTDTVLLRNGDQLSGTIERKENGELLIKTKDAGSITIRWGAVSSLRTAAPATLQVSPDRVLDATLTPADPGTVMLAETAEILPLESILAINPPPYVIGRGSQWKGHFNSTLSKSDGNTQTESLHAEGESTLRTRSNRYTLGALYNRAEDGGMETEAGIKGHAKIDHFFSPRWYGLANGSAEKDRFQDLKLRSTAGLGLGYQAVEGKRRNLSLEIGASYLREVFIVADNNEYPAGRWALKYDRFLVSSLLQFFHGHELFVGLDDAESMLLSSQTGIRMQTTKSIYILGQVNYDWNNTPATGKERGSTTYLFGLGAHW